MASFQNYKTRIAQLEAEDGHRRVDLRRFVNHLLTGGSGKTCELCGKQSQEAANFCMWCGHKFGTNNVVDLISDTEDEETDDEVQSSATPASASSSSSSSTPERYEIGEKVRTVSAPIIYGTIDWRNGYRYHVKKNGGGLEWFNHKDLERIPPSMSSSSSPIASSSSSSSSSVKKASASASASAHHSSDSDDDDSEEEESPVRKRMRERSQQQKNNREKRARKRNPPKRGRLKKDESDSDDDDDDEIVVVQSSANQRSGLSDDSDDDEPIDEKPHAELADHELTLTLSPSPYVCPPPRGMERLKPWEIFWLRRDKPKVTLNDIINHFYYSAAGGYNRNVKEEMTWILKFIHEELGRISYDVSMTFGETEAIAEAKKLLEKYNALRTMGDVIEEKIRVQNEKFAYAQSRGSPFARMYDLRMMTGYKGIMYRKKCLGSSSSASASSSSSSSSASSNEENCNPPPFVEKSDRGGVLTTTTPTNTHEKSFKLTRNQCKTLPYLFGLLSNERQQQIAPAAINIQGRDGPFTERLLDEYRSLLINPGYEKGEGFANIDQLRMISDSLHVHSTSIYFGQSYIVAGYLDCPHEEHSECACDQKHLRYVFIVGARGKHSRASRGNKKYLNLGSTCIEYLQSRNLGMGSSNLDSSLKEALREHSQKKRVATPAQMFKIHSELSKRNAEGLSFEMRAILNKFTPAFEQLKNDRRLTRNQFNVYEASNLITALMNSPLRSGVSAASAAKPAWHYHPASPAQKYSIRRYISGKMRQMIQECEIPFPYDDSITEEANMENLFRTLKKGQASCIITKVKPRYGYSSYGYR